MKFSKITLDNSISRHAISPNMAPSVETIVFIIGALNLDYRRSPLTFGNVTIEMYERLPEADDFWDVEKWAKATEIYVVKVLVDNQCFFCYETTKYMVHGRNPKEQAARDLEHVSVILRKEKMTYDLNSHIRV